MKKSLGIICTFAVLTILVSLPWSSGMTSTGTDHIGEAVASYPVIPDNPSPAVRAPATVSAWKPSPITPIHVTADSAHFTPSSFDTTLASGQCATETKTLFLPANSKPRKLDLVVCMDLTGSMGGELSNAQINSNSIANALRGLIPDSDFGVISHKDYPGFHNGCGYGTFYGTAGTPCFDYAYSLDQAVTGNIGDFSTALNGLTLGCGGDGPECYSRALYESYADPGVGWRPGAKRILLQWGDAVPHDCAFDAILGGSTSTGPDPGRDEIDNNADDLQILNVLNGMAANKVTLVSLHSGSFLSLWQAYAAVTGGNAFQINGDGTIPGGIDIPDFIADLVESTTTHIDTLRVAACDSSFNAWIKSVSPPYYTNITLDHDQSFDFTIEYCVPPGTPDGTYCFDVCAFGDGAEFATQHVCITVQNNQPPNCSAATASPSVLWPPNHKYNAIAITGVTDPDGDPVTVTVTGITQDEPLNGGGDGNTCPDGLIAGGQASVRAERTGIPAVPGNGRVYVISFEASDGRGGVCRGSVSVCVPHDQSDPTCIDDGQRFNSLGPCHAGDGSGAEVVVDYGLRVTSVSGAQVGLEYSLAADADVEIAAFDVAGRRVATIENTRHTTGVYPLAWNMRGIPNGMYFVRMRAGNVVMTRTVLKAQ